MSKDIQDEGSTKGKGIEIRWTPEVCGTNIVDIDECSRLFPRLYYFHLYPPFHFA